jgi:transcriptional regulator with XRE-family HTH domain
MRALASLIGVSSVTVWKWEKGDSKPRARLIAPLARALDVAPRQLHAAVRKADSPGEIAEPGSVGEGDLATSELSRPSMQEDESGLGQAEPLAEVIARAKQMIAEASGTGSNNITIVIEY